MIKVWFLPYVKMVVSRYATGAIIYRHTDKKEYLGISQQLFAQMIGWTE